MAAPPDGPPGDTERLDEKTVLLDLLFSHRMGWIQDFLRERKLPTTGNKDVLRTRVESLFDDGTLSLSDLVVLLDKVEGWGNQHVYLYRANDGLLA
ncbi:MAG TPA: SAP domain-containing protein, partial [Gemmataceae bacterium]|nr:SAP domain-containing protein [Gemmataceae bacterium]